MKNALGKSFSSTFKPRISKSVFISRNSSDLKKSRTNLSKSQEVSSEMLSISQGIEFAGNVFDQITKMKEFYSILSIPEIRCFKHNSNIILYCKNDQVLLCSTCSYGDNFHKKHNLIEAVKSELNVKSDLRIMEKKVKDYQKQFETSRINWNNCLLSLQEKYQTQLTSLEILHDRKIQKLSNKFLLAKNNIESKYKKVKSILIQKEEIFHQLSKHGKFTDQNNFIRHIKLNKTFQCFDFIKKKLCRSSQGQKIVNNFEKYAKMVIRHQHQ